MKFSDMLVKEVKQEALVEVQQEPKGKQLNPEEVLRDAKFKIKLITPTSFGTQIEFAKQYETDELDAVLKGFNYKIKGKSVFIID